MSYALLLDMSWIYNVPISTLPIKYIKEGDYLHAQEGVDIYGIVVAVAHTYHSSEVWVYCHNVADDHCFFLNNNKQVHLSIRPADHLLYRSE